MYKQETRSADLAKLLSQYDVILMDTCSLMEDSFPEFMDNLSGNDYWDGQITVLKQCVQELKKHTKSGDANKKIDAKRALKILRHDAWHARCVRIEKKVKSNRDFADKVLFNLVNDLRTDKRVLVITQDKKLAYDIRSLNHLGSQRGYTVEVLKLRQGGELVPNYGADENGFRANAQGVASPQKGRRPEHRDIFHRDATPVKPSIDIEPILSEDRRLSANLSNPNYPIARKLEDIDAQITRLRTVKDSSQLRLAYTLDQLLAEKSKLQSKPSPTRPANASKAEAPSSKPAAQSTPKAAKEVEKPSMPSQKPPKPSPSTSPHTEKGRNASFAFERLGEYHGWLFRDASIPYNRFVHGDYDLTSDDLTRMDNLASGIAAGSETDLYFRSLVVHVRRDTNCFYVSLASGDKEYEASGKPKTAAKPKPIASSKETPQPASATKPKMSSASQPAKGSSAKKTKLPAPKEKQVASKPASSKPAKTATKPAPAKKETPTKRSARPVSTAQNGLAAVPEGVTLHVGGPKESGKQVSKAKTSQPAKPATKKTVSATPKTSKPAPKSPASSKKAAQDSSTPAKPRSKTTVGLSRPAAKEGDSSASQTAANNLEAALKADKNLHRNLNNPNYPKDKKIKDIKAQISLIRTLKPSEAKKLLLGLRPLEKRLKELEGAK